MIVTVAADLAADIRHSLYCGFPAFHILPQHKECRMSIVFLQTVQKLIRIFSRSVVKGQGNPCFMFIRVIGTVLVEIQVVKSIADPPGLYVSVIVKGISNTVNLLEASGEICTVKILIPFSVFVLMPSCRQVGSFGQIVFSLQRLPDSRIRICLHGLCLRLNLYRLVGVPAADSPGYGKDHAPYQKCDYKHNAQHISHKTHDLPSP